MKSRFKPKLQVEKREGQFLPLTQYDADEIEAHPNGQLYDVKPVADRSDPHHKLYWAILGKVGHYRTVVNQASGGIYYIPDSTAYSKMNQKEFNEYFDQAMAKLSETLQYDPTVLE